MRLLLLVVWGVLTLAAAGFVLACGCNAPAVDEWEFVAVLVGKEPVRPWLWAQHNEHRLPLPKLVYLTQFRLSHDFRSGMLLEVALLSALSLGLMRLADRLRGRPDWADVFFPVSLLHLGHWENFLLGYQICFALFLVCVTGLVVVALRTTRESAFRSGVLAAGLLLLAALTGGSGLALVPPVAAWLVYLVWIIWRGGRRKKALALAALALVPVAYLAVYFVGYQRPENHPPPSRDPVAILNIAGQVMAMGMGIGVNRVWQLVALAELVLGVVTIVMLVRRGKDSAERPASAGLIAVAAGVAGVAVAVGIGRAGFDDPTMGLWSRYAFLTWPLLGAAYLAWVKAGRGEAPSGLAKWVPVALCVAAALAFPPNTGTGLVIGADIVARDTALEADVRRGISDDELIRRHFPHSRNGGQEDRGRWAIPMLREARIGIFSPDPRDARSLVWALRALAVLVVVALIGRWLWHLAKAVQTERARELFRLQHERFEQMLLKAAGATGLPRGLRWVSCQITGDALLVRDLATGSIVALVPVVIQFEPVEGSDMEDVPAAREPRPATAVFTYARGTWVTSGRVVFNHTPEQTVATFASQFRVIHHGHH